MSEVRRGRKPKAKIEEVVSMDNVKKVADIIPEAMEDLSLNYVDPLEAELVERSYSKTDVIDSIGDIPEPDYSAGAPDLSEEIEDAVEEEIEPEPSPFDNVKNPEMENLSGKEKKNASEQLVETALGGYELIHQLFQKIASIDEGKINEKLISGDIDSNLRVPIAEDGSSVNVLEYAKLHNEQSKEALSYDPEFGEKVKPAMVRVFMKKGWGITDEQYLLGAFLQDIAVKSTMIYGMKKQSNEMIKHFMNASQNQRQQPKHETYEPDSVETPKPKRKVKVKEEEIDDVEEIEVTTEDIEKDFE